MDFFEKKTFSNSLARTLLFQVILLLFPGKTTMLQIVTIFHLYYFLLMSYFTWMNTYTFIELSVNYFFFLCTYVHYKRTPNWRWY